VDYGFWKVIMSWHRYDSFLVKMKLECMIYVNEEEKSRNAMIASFSIQIDWPLVQMYDKDVEQVLNLFLLLL
jgi:hypothetical protein